MSSSLTLVETHGFSVHPAQSLRFDPSIATEHQLQPFHSSMSILPVAPTTIFFLAALPLLVPVSYLNRGHIFQKNRQLAHRPSLLCFPGRSNPSDFFLAVHQKTSCSLPSSRSTPLMDPIDHPLLTFLPRLFTACRLPTLGGILCKHHRAGRSNRHTATTL